VKSLSLPTADNSRDFYLGGVYAVVLFVLIALIFFRLLQGLDKIHSYALEQRSTVTVSLVSEPLPTAAQVNTPRPEPKPKPKETEAPAAPPEAAPVEDISSLFSDVKTQKIVHKKAPEKQQKIDAKRIAALQKRIKTTEKRQTSATAERVKNLSLVKPMQSPGGKASSGGKEVNAYYAKIQATIYDHFFPPANTEGSVAMIRIWLSASGNLVRFKVLRHAGDASFDREVEQLEARLRGVTFERNPQGKEITLDVSLVSKE